MSQTVLHPVQFAGAVPQQRGLRPGATGSAGRYGGSDPGIHAQLQDPVQARSWDAQVGEAKTENPERHAQMTNNGTGSWGVGSEPHTSEVFHD